ncbi:SpoIID/LytB domain-containing protein [Thermohalobacter berrensis]|uniref:Sporulation stage II protein D amidase enhancer LytB N-terminal domain-containing protein n=1 Tax=Thermohalobacter berrensis TaxID=99594 RepID=A0A419TB28_9FIRM|nr:SpoIID/LytB domain-containing protein [Thermohalobacter berrensis]RKD34662.1 hypothetical protein BET03_02205 [Thermohalobacter berrensis]
MKRKIGILFILLCVFVTMITLDAYGIENDEKYIRVGLKRPVYSNYYVTLKASNNFFLGFWNNSFEEFIELDKENILVRLDDFYIKENGIYKRVLKGQEPQIGPYHIKVEKEFRTYEEVLEEIDILKDKGIKAYPLYDSGFKLGIGQYTSTDETKRELSSLKEKLDYKLEVVENDFNKVVIEDEKGDIILIYNANDNIYIKSKDLIAVEDNRYRDYITFDRNNDELITINYVTLKHYLYGVVPREMSPNWPLEALKAQAVAARNYALTSMYRHADEGYDLCDTIHCQVYGGYDWERSRSNRAVDETSGKILKYKGNLVVTYFHSSSGGYTENSENVWSTRVPYLRGVKDEFSLGSPNDNWKIVMDKEKINEKLKSSGIDVGNLIKLRPIEYSENGRVIELEVIGTERSVILEKNKIRQVFGYNNLKSTLFQVETDADIYVLNGYSSKPVKTTLESVNVISGNGYQLANRSRINRFKSNFNITNGSEKNVVPSSPNKYIFNGKGWGHGLGMSQWGAKKMAELGYTYEEILKHYYMGTKLE